MSRARLDELFLLSGSRLVISRRILLWERVNASNNNKAVSIDTYYVSAHAGTRTYTQEDRTCGHAWFYAISLCPQRD